MTAPDGLQHGQVRQQSSRRRSVTGMRIGIGHPVDMAGCAEDRPCTCLLGDIGWANDRDGRGPFRSAPAARMASSEIERPNTTSSVRAPAVSLSSQSEFGESDARVIALPPLIAIHRSGVPWRKRCSTTLR